MAAYATVADVRARIATQLCKIEPGGQPTTAQVEAWLEQKSRWMDATLRWRYTVPVTDTGDLSILGPICADLVAAMVWGVVASHDAAYAGVGDRLAREARQSLAYDAKTGQAMLVLPSTTESESGPATTAQPEGSFTDPDDDDSVPRMFSTDMEF